MRLFFSQNFSNRSSFSWTKWNCHQDQINWQNIYVWWLDKYLSDKIQRCTKASKTMNEIIACDWPVNGKTETKTNEVENAFSDRMALGTTRRRKQGSLWSSYKWALFVYLLHFDRSIGKFIGRRWHFVTDIVIESFCFLCVEEKGKSRQEDNSTSVCVCVKYFCINSGKCFFLLLLSVK